MSEFFECEQALHEGIAIKNPMMWSAHTVMCTGFHAKDVTISSSGVNNDGTDLDMSQDVLIEDYNFQIKEVATTTERAWKATQSTS